ncbi:MAG: 16S rRNA processing protein RimM [Eubacterium sp.]|nr:16S rRNA processing protein RimM [Candidatus Colimonas fimequi]
MEKILIGKVTTAVGIKGELRVYNYSDSDEIYRNTKLIYMEDELYKVEKVRMQKNMVVLKLKGIDDRNTAELARGKEIFVTEADLPELEEGVFYIRDLIGMDVVTEEEELIGVVTDVLQNTAQDIFEIKTEEGKQVLIPKVDQFVLNIDGKERKITVRLIEGLLDL